AARTASGEHRQSCPLLPVARASALRCQTAELPPPAGPSAALRRLAHHSTPRHLHPLLDRHRRRHAHRSHQPHQPLHPLLPPPPPLPPAPAPRSPPARPCPRFRPACRFGSPRTDAPPNFPNTESARLTSSSDSPRRRPSFLTLARPITLLLSSAIIVTGLTAQCIALHTAAQCTPPSAPPSTPPHPPSRPTAP